ncbi:MAG: histidine phosphatase family protein [Thermoleophilia bacterium]|nr:histidine phosphatase family protein [Thermoleophilia bacterium]
MERAILVRHGESVLSARGIVSGRANVSCPLTERGVAQARALAGELAGEEIDLCVTSALERARQTADIVLAGRGVQRLVLAALNDPLYGAYEHGPLAAYLEWALAHDSVTEPPGGGEARRSIAARYASAFRTVLERPERTVLVVAHLLPLAYAFLALEGRDPAPRVPLVDYAKPYRLTADELERIAGRLESWCASPTW